MHCLKNRQETFEKQALSNPSSLIRYHLPVENNTSHNSHHVLQNHPSLCFLDSPSVPRLQIVDIIFVILSYSTNVTLLQWSIISVGYVPACDQQFCGIHAQDVMSPIHKGTSTSMSFRNAVKTFIYDGQRRCHNSRPWKRQKKHTQMCNIAKRKRIKINFKSQMPICIGLISSHDLSVGEIFTFL